MKKLTVLTFCILQFAIFNHQLQAQINVFIPDTNFRNFLNTSFPSVIDPSGDSLIIAQANTVAVGVSCSYQNIADLTGIEYFINIPTLWCDGNQLTSLPDLSAITGLGFLYCHNNLLTVLPDLSANTALLTLRCDNNQLTALPDLSAITGLQNLTCGLNPLNSLPDLSANTALQTLSCPSNSLTVLPDLSANTALQTLTCYDNQLTTLPDLSANTALQTLSCPSNSLTVLPDLSANTALLTLRCYNNQLTILPDLSANTGLLSLYCYNNSLTVLPDLSANTALQTLDCSSNQLTALPDLSANIALQVIRCGSNQLTAMPDLTNNNALQSLWCEDNLLTALPDLTNNTALQQLYCYNNKLDFSDARELRIADTISTLTTYYYSPQDPFGVAATFNLNDGDTLILSIANQDSALSYQWFRNITNTIVGATDTLLIIPNVTTAESGAYTCRSYGTALLYPSPMSFSPGISSFVSEGFLVNISTVGLNELFDTDNWLKLYPNPNTGEFTLELVLSGAEGQINITNILGQLVWTANSGQSADGLPLLFLGEGRGEVKINLKSIPAGIYNLQVISDRAIFNKKLIIE